MPIKPTQADIGRSVIYTPYGDYPNKKIEEGVITSFNDRVVFVRYGSATGSSPTDPLDLDFAHSFKGVPLVAGEAKPAGEVISISDVGRFKSKVKLEPERADAAPPELKLDTDIALIEALETELIWREIKQRLFVLANRHGVIYTTEQLEDAIKELRR